MAVTLEAVPQNITEDEAALYDRQIRLWGIEAQQRMRNATICVINLRGVAAEVIKNIVLAGIGKLIILDSEDVKVEDLGAGFLFRESDVGKKRVDAAKLRVENLNPLVAVETISNFESLDTLDSLILGVDIVCVTDGSRDDLIRVNNLCRKLQKRFYAGGSYGLTGYIFCDLLVHEYIPPDRSVNAEQAKPLKHSVKYPSLSEALKHDWQTLTKKQAKQQNVELAFLIFALWTYESQHGVLPSDTSAANELASILKSLMTSARINPQALQPIPLQQIESLASTASCEFPPVCAVLGGLIGQDLLKTMGGRDPPIANFFVFDGQKGSGAVSSLRMPP